MSSRIPARRAGDYDRKPSRPRAPARIEIQIHPGDIRRRVRYLFFTRRRLIWIAAGVAAWLVFVALGGVLAPRVVRGYMDRQEYRTLKAERQRQGQRLEALVERMRELEGRAGDLRLQVDKIFLAYGLDGEQSIGQGGFPPPPVPEEGDPSRRPMAAAGAP